MTQKSKKKSSPNIDTIVQAVEMRTQYDPVVIKRIIMTLIDELPKLLVDYGSVVLMNLGVFTLRLRKNSINPKTQEVLRKPSISLTFKQSKSIKQAIAREQGDAKAKLEKDIHHLIESNKSKE